MQRSVLFLYLLFVSGVLGARQETKRKKTVVKTTTTTTTARPDRNLSSNKLPGRGGFPMPVACRNITGR
ncbi:hypothetical protein JTE90_010209 [Oedothorax gibbosus]|uniref:Uncharacterized protein n=1 Tax=Oedothorax gibbosus TaxID=931172 RepID=A0AAV6UKF5_9ARAC|nr:hypothetical protein JTE90_010209 [Oedothorax gibbosus]